MEKIISVYRRKGKIIIGPNHKTTDGVWIDSGPYEICTDSIDTGELGKIILKTIKKSKNGIPHPISWDGFTKPLQKASGVKSYSSFLNGTLRCSVELSDKLYFMPYRNGGYKGDAKGFHEISEEQFSILANSPDDKIGKSLLDALEKCK